MAHCPYHQLHDLEAVLDRIRQWPEIREPSPGVFYVKRTPFLHFHLSDGMRWADARDGVQWGPPLEIPLAAASSARKHFLEEAESRYRTTVASMPARRPVRKGKR